MQTIRIRNERPYFWQWDQHQQVEIIGVEGPCQVHFTQQDSAEGCLVVEPQRESDLLVAAVPNILLQTAAPITVYIYRCDEARYTDCHAVFNVAAREKPTDYVYTETEVLTWEALKAYCEEHVVPPNLQIGEVTTLPAGSAAQASISGTTAKLILHLGIPTGSQGATGKDGGQGVPGVSPTVQVTDIEGGHRVAITDASGVHTFDVMDGDIDGAVQSVNGKTGAVKLSASDVNAAPSGYGLGAQTPKITPEELNTTTNNGWYRIMSSTSFSVAGFNMTDAWLHVSRYMDTYLVQKLYPMTGNKVEIVRWCLAGTWHEEFVNPPMYAGTEYRTTERYNGAPVYTKKVTYSFSDTIGSTSGVTTIRIPHSISGFGTLVRCVGRVPGVNYVFPYLGGSGGVTVVNAVSASDIVVRLTNMTWEANTFEFDLYYTK